MKSKLLGLAAVAALAIGFASSGAHAGPSAKFAADWATNRVEFANVQVTDCADDGNGANIDADCSDYEAASNTKVRAAALLTTIKVPQDKEMLIGVSGEASLLTFTEAKGKNDGGEVVSSAEANLNLEVRFAPVETSDVCVTGSHSVAAPGAVTFSSRKQTMTLDVSSFDDADDGTVAQVALALELDTVAAHHFNFVAVDVPADEYGVWACFSGDALAEVVIENGGTSTGSAKAVVAIQKRMLTVQEVRAVRESL